MFGEALVSGDFRAEDENRASADWACTVCQIYLTLSNPYEHPANKKYSLHFWAEEVKALGGWAVHVSSHKLRWTGNTYLFGLMARGLFIDLNWEA